jgi:hypothetical protein
MMILKKPILVILAFLPLLILCVFSCKTLSTETRSTETTSIATATIENMPEVLIKKADVLYTGIYNPLEITFPLGNSSDYEINCEGVDCKIYNHQGDYIIEVFSRGEVDVVISKEGELNKYPLKIENIPESLPSFHPFKIQSNGKMSPNSFKGRRGLFAVVKDFPYNIKCKIEGFELIRTSTKGEAMTSINTEAQYQEESAQLIRLAEAGDTYSFTNIKVRCSGDKMKRELVPMTWELY